MNKKHKIGYSFILCSILLNSLNAKDVNSLGKLTVTANKTEEVVQEVPKSITVIDEVTLEERGIRTVKDIVREIPNLTIQDNSGKNEMNIRGLNTSFFTYNNPVVLYIDGIPHTNRYGYDASLMNIERIEVLRGPQGSLYGKDAIGGVINIITKKPSDTWEGTVGAEYGSDNKMKGTFQANGPVAESFYAGIYGSLSKDDGWIENNNISLDKDGNDEEDMRLGLNMLYTPTDNFSARLHIIHEDQEKGFIDGGTTGTRKFQDVKRKDYEKANFDVDTFLKTQTDSQGLNLEYKNDYGTFTAITTNRNIDVDGQFDTDYSRFPTYNNAFFSEYLNIDTISQELRWSKELASGIKWVSGLYYEKETVEYEDYGIRNWIISGSSKGEGETKSSAIFGQVSIPFYEDFELTLGGRYQYIEKDIDVTNTFVFAGPAIKFNTKKDWNTFLPKATLTYNLDDFWTLYSSITTGYMTGGFNPAPQTTDIESNSYKPTETLNYEVGAKASLLDDQLFLSTSLFYMDIENIHVNTVTASGQVATGNAKEAYSQGIEIEANYMINESWQTNLAFSATKAEYDNYINSSNHQLAGNKIEKTPEYTINFGLQYNDPSDYYVRTDVYHVGEQYFDDKNLLKEGSYTTVNLKAGYWFDSWHVYGYMNNLTDTDYKTFSRDGMVGTGQYVMFGEPRQFGIGVQYTF